YWANCLPHKQQMMGYQRILKKFPNAAFAHERIAHLFFEEGDMDSAQSHIQKAMQLDSRRSKNKALLAQCYAKRCEWEKAIAAYQSSEWLYLDQHHDLLHAQQQFLHLKGIQE
ncbi:tetratricopeptide repeat protein, partial [Candidatus Poribacteria bacterium]|nr:tetratricopeptide repeat protein [Candidatus Poribacteria bacterium]